MLSVVTYWWGEKYPQSYVDKLKASVKRNLTKSHEFIVFSDRLRETETRPIPEQDIYLTQMKGCFARLRLFDTVFQRLNGLHGQIAVLDLDLVVTGNIDHLFNEDKDEFKILQGINGSNPCPYNGSVWSFKAGVRPDVWRDFSVAAYHHHRVPYYSFPDDQGWFSFKFPRAGYYGPANGVYAYMKRGWTPEGPLPDNACVVAFPGFRDPSMFTHVDWVKEHWNDRSA